MKKNLPSRMDVHATTAFYLFHHTPYSLLRNNNGRFFQGSLRDPMGTGVDDNLGYGNVKAHDDDQVYFHGLARDNAVSLIDFQGSTRHYQLSHVSFMVLHSCNLSP